MKKLFKLIILNIILFVPFMVHAAGGLGVSPTYLDVQVGGSGSFNVCLNNAAGRVDLSVNGPISISTTSIFLDNGCQTVTVSGSTVTYTSVNIYTVDGTTYDDEDITGQSSSVTVNVYQPQNNNNNNNYNNNNNNNNNKKQETLSNDTSLASVTVGSYEVVKDGTKYLVTVPSDVDKVVISANTTQFRASLTGGGEKTLAPGENVFVLRVVAPDGTIASYYVVITRKSDYFKLSNIDEALALEATSVNFKLQDGDKLTPEILEKMKASKKTINLYYYDSDNTLLYAWIMDTSVLNTKVEFNPILLLELEDEENILKKINYVDSLMFKVDTKVPSGAKLRFNIASKYSSSDVLAAYKYDNGTITVNSTNNKKTKDFSISNTNFYELTPESDSIFIITKGNLLNESTVTTLSKTKTVVNNTYFWVAALELGVIITLGFYIIFREINKKTKKATATVSNDNLFLGGLFKPKKEKVEFMVPGVVPPQKEVVDDKPIYTAEVPVNVVPPVKDIFVKKEKVEEVESVKESAPLVIAPPTPEGEIPNEVVTPPAIEAPVVDSIEDVPVVETPVANDNIQDEKVSDGSIDTVVLDKIDIK